jgi:hypothetical protein
VPEGFKKIETLRAGDSKSRARYLSTATEAEMSSTGDEEAAAAMVRNAQGNFRTLAKLAQRVESVLKVNGLAVADARAVRLAREQLLLGTS